MQLLAACQRPRRCAVRAEVVHRGLRLRAHRSGQLPRGRGPRTRRSTASARTPRRSRATSGRSAGGARTSTSRSCASRTCWGHGSTAPSSRCSTCRWSRRCWASTRACSSATRRTPSRCSNGSRPVTTPGIFNVAGDGVLYLSQCIRLAGRVARPVPLPFVSGVARGAALRAGRCDPDQLRFLQFGRVVDTTRLREELGISRASRRARPSRTSCGAAGIRVRRPRGGHPLGARAVRLPATQGPGALPRAPT
jgi:hypothetical protein